MKITAESQYLRAMLKRNKRIEMRLLGDSVLTGLFNDYQAIKTAIHFAEAKKLDAYITLNPVNSAIKVTNKLVSGRKAVTDSDIARIGVIPFDFDPVRETGAAASDDEVALAVDRADGLCDYLMARGWGNPTIGYSGNGCHLLYYVNLQNDDTTKNKLREIYLGLKLRFSDDEVNFDTTVRNPSRIFRLYGTTNHKAGRKSSVYINPDIQLLDAGIIDNLAKEIAPPPPAKPSVLDRKKASEHGIQYIKNFDVVSLFYRNGLYKRPLDGSKHAVTCLWADSHSSTDDLNKTDCVIWAGEWPQYHCSHDHCHDKGIKDVINFLGVSHATA